jgi:hypothetical protein
MSNPMPTGDHTPSHTPSHTPGSHLGGSEPFPHTPHSEQPSQWGGEPTSTYGSPPQYQPYTQQYQPYQQPYQPAGAPPYPGYPPQYVPGMNPTNPLAIASLIVSIVGFGLIGVILGHIALSQIKRSNGYERGRGLAIAGLIIGYAEIAIGLLIMLFFFSLILIGPTVVPTN